MEFGEKLDDLAARFEVEVSGGLIAEKDRRLVEQRSRQSDPLPLAARKGRRAPPAPAVQADGRKKLVCPSAHPRSIAPLLSAGEERGDGHIFTAGQVIEEVVGLENVADGPVPKSRNLGISEGSEISPIHLDPALIGGIETTDQIEQSRLAGAGPSDDRNKIV